MDYSQLSDFEINKAVAISVGFQCYYGDGSYTNNLGLRGAIVKGENDSGLFMVGEFNPCNNPADAWPIIKENMISIINLDEDEWGARGMAYCKSKRAIHENPLRAAMIVFLMMQDANNA
ncbi:DUF2591 domain-containing protein [Escherichia coli]|nr:phage protein NinX family protein [Escherichia coli]EEQ3040097.1 DUF2591 domain-containing protein [Escherichia coli]EEQ8950659.1 DUF2591 domain-containing protein [Escherichia coli]EER4255243.1 DUF2591 domain-containing protein [Escherichia coli]EER7585114.1 DUF2591 domain-containing protein [Escherichia coli]EER7828571.1 DUF2591 domain-containing protein [Escherichia coli]